MVHFPVLVSILCVLYPRVAISGAAVVLSRLTIGFAVLCVVLYRVGNSVRFPVLVHVLCVLYLGVVTSVLCAALNLVRFKRSSP